MKAYRAFWRDPDAGVGRQHWLSSEQEAADWLAMEWAVPRYGENASIEPSGIETVVIRQRAKNLLEWLNERHTVAHLEEGRDGVPACRCHDCKRPYGDGGFQDLVITNDAWRRISPSGDENGLLCPSCICARLSKSGIECEGAFMSGPIISVSRSEFRSITEEPHETTRQTPAADP